jgi:hypothetical protein
MISERQRNVMITQLDKELSEILRPLVELGVVARVSPFPNTMCLGFHYLFAHGRKTVPSDRIDLADWNRPHELMARDRKHLPNSIYLFYQTKTIAQAFSHEKETGGGFFDSISVTHFRPRFAFLHATDTAKQIVNDFGKALTTEFFKKLIESKHSINVRTDVQEQTEALMNAICPTDCLAKIRYVGKGWPLGASTDEDRITLLLYGAPGTTYMKNEPSAFIPLEIEDNLIRDSPAFDTRVLWHVPAGKANETGTVRKCIDDYHKRLFQSASADSTGSGFTAMAIACNEVLGKNHPSYPYKVFANQSAFRACLSEHHAPPS